MKLYLASFLEPENFGPGRLIGIVRDNEKPLTISVSLKFNQLTPQDQILKQYVSEKSKDIELAKNNFVNQFRQQLDSFYEQVLLTSKEKNRPPQDLLPFQEGDTLLSWERSFRNNYRYLVAEILQKLGYSIILN